MKRTVLLALCLLLLACTQAPPPLEGTEWTLVSVNGKVPLEGHSITLHFKSKEMGGRSGCNSYGGGYEVDGTRLRFQGIASTAMACSPEPIMDQEEEFHRTLQQVQTYRMAGYRLELKEGDGQPVLIFDRAD